MAQKPEWKQCSLKPQKIQSLRDTEEAAPAKIFQLWQGEQFLEEDFVSIIIWSFASLRPLAYCTGPIKASPEPGISKSFHTRPAPRWQKTLNLLPNPSAFQLLWKAGLHQHERGMEIIPATLFNLKPPLEYAESLFDPTGQIELWLRYLLANCNRIAQAWAESGPITSNLPYGSYWADICRTLEVLFYIQCWVLQLCIPQRLSLQRDRNETLFRVLASWPWKLKSENN